MNWTKTIQKGERILRIPLVPLEKSILCPVHAYRRMCRHTSAADDAPLFCLPNKKLLTYNCFQAKLRTCINKIGLNSNIFSTHSFRRGGATLLFRAKVSADKIQLMGDWKSDAYKRYLAYTLEDKIQISKVIGQYIVENSSVSSRT